MTGKPFDFARQREYERWTRQHFPDIRGAAFHVLYIGLPALERTTRVGFGGRVVANLDRWASETGDDRRTVTKGLSELAKQGLITWVRGEASTRAATAVRRCPVEKLAKEISPAVLHAYIPADIEALAKNLEARGVVWGGSTLCPRFTVQLTGRIVTTNPCMHTSPESKRCASLSSGLLNGEMLVSCDYVQAEPTVVLRALSDRGLMSATAQAADLYQELGALRGIRREEAKKDLLRVFYSPCRRLTVPDSWNVPSGHVIRQVIQAVVVLRETLWRDGRPRRGESRHVCTLDGRKMILPRGRRAHRGQVLSWLSQGTVADVIATAIKNLIDVEATANIRFLLSVYDNVYVAVQDAQGVAMVETIMRDAAASNGVALQVKTQARERRERRAYGG